MTLPYRKILLPLGLIALGLVCVWLFVATKPQPGKGKPAPTSPLVTVSPVSTGRADIVVSALGTVTPAQEVALRPRVSGTVVELSPLLQPGSRVSANSLLVRLDPEDYRIEVARKESALAKAKADLALEMGQQTIARKELRDLQNVLPQVMNTMDSGNQIALRAPHLAQAKAAVAAAQAELEAAQNNLDRTRLSAPFDALVTSRNISIGSQATSQEAVATLVGTEAFWVEAAVPLDRLESAGLSRIESRPATVFTSSGQSRAGLVLGHTGSLSQSARMGHVLVRVEDPLALGQTNLPPLILGDQVRVDIHAGSRDGLVKLPRALLRAGDTVWTVKNNTLDIRPVKVFWRDVDTVFLESGLEDGELVIASDLIPIQGMNLRVDKPREAKTPVVPAAQGNAASPGNGGGPR